MPIHDEKGKELCETAIISYDMDTKNINTADNDMDISIPN